MTPQHIANVYASRDRAARIVAHLTQNFSGRSQVEELLPVLGNDLLLQDTPYLHATLRGLLLKFPRPQGSLVGTRAWHNLWVTVWPRIQDLVYR